MSVLATANACSHRPLRRSGRISTPSALFGGALFDAFFAFDRPRAYRPGRWPRTRIHETDEGLVVTFEVPGFGHDALSLTTDGKELTLKGVWADDTADSDEDAAAGQHTTFTRRFTLPDEVDADRLTARLQNGVLTLTLPSIERLPPREITITTK